MQRIIITTIFLLNIVSFLSSQSRVTDFIETSAYRETSMKTIYLTPQRVIWASEENILNIEEILNKGTGQADLNSGNHMILKKEGSIILDFGREIQGGIQIVTTKNNSNPAGKVRIRFGESVSETCSDVGQNGATNDHAMRDDTITLSWLGTTEFGNTGFRFVRIDGTDDKAEIEIKEISARFTYRDIPYVGSFSCDDEVLNKIWQTGAYTVHLNMQDYLWDGIKRDRLIWVGDLHPEIMTVSAVFGYNDVVPKSLDFIRDTTPLPNWMNGISSYSIWWLIIQRDWYYFHGDLDYLKQQRDYISELLKLLSKKIDDSGKEQLDGWRFLDWPSSENPKAIHAGLQSLLVMAFNAGLDLSKVLKDNEGVRISQSTLSQLGKYKPSITDTKQADALMALANLYPAVDINNQVLSKDGTKRMSTFYGYYILQARAKAGDIDGALQNIKEYWGGMLKLGATTFWEDFNIDWLDNAAQIDEMIPDGRTDVHAVYGNYCYKGFRHSFCHGWASGPTSWLTENVLGIKVVEPGCRTVKIAPQLGNLKWAKGTFPTPYGIIEVYHEKNSKGKITSRINAPKEITVIKSE